MKTFPVIGAVATTFLAACGGGSSGVSTQETVPTEQLVLSGNATQATVPVNQPVNNNDVSLTELGLRLVEFEQEFGTTSLDSPLIELQRTSPADIPSSASATYTGTAFFATVSDVTGITPQIENAAAASTTMTANFSDGSVNGTVGNFYAAENPQTLLGGDFDIDQLTPVGGAMSYDLAQQNGANVYSGSLTGSYETVDQQQITVDATAGGQFLGSDLDGFSVEAISLSSTQGTLGQLLLNKD